MFLTGIWGMWFDYTFSEMDKLTGLDVANWNISNVRGLEYTFYNSPHILVLDVSKWNTSKVKAINGLFWGTGISEIDVSNWDVSNVEAMYCTFANLSKITKLDISNWDTSKVMNFYGTFHGMRSLSDIDISKLNFASAQSTGKLFLQCYNLNGTLNMNGTNITDYTQMFYGILFNEKKQITINYTAETEQIVEGMLHETDKNANLVKGALIS